MMITDTTNTDNDNDIAAAGKTLCNAAACLQLALYERMTAADRAAFDALTADGCAAAITIKWLPDRVELRAGAVGRKGESNSLLAIDYPAAPPRQTMQ